MQKNASIMGIKVLGLWTLAHLTGIYADVLPYTDTDFETNFDLRLTAVEKKMAVNDLNPEKASRYYVATEFFLWQAAENGLPFAIKMKNPPTLPLSTVSFQSTLENGHVENIHFHWDPGFRFTTGYRWPSELNLSLTWLRFFTKGGRSVHAGGTSQIAPTQLFPAAGLGNLPGEPSVAGISPLYFSKAHADWYAHLNQLDLDMSRPFHIGKWLGLSPHAGIRTTWLQQRLSVDYDHDLILVAIDLYTSGTPHGDDYAVRKKVGWWGIGPEAGLGISVGFGRGWSILADVTGTLEYGFQAIKEKDIDSTVASTGADGVMVNVTDHFNMIRPILDFQLGLAWDHHFKGSRCCLRLEGAWELHVYYSQNQFPFFYNATDISKFSNPGNFITDQGDLSYQGWKLAARLDF